MQPSADVLGDDSALLPMDSQDSFWLHTDSPENLMIVNCLLFFKQRLSLPRLQELLRASLFNPRFLSLCVVDASGRDCWRLDPNFDIRLHCYRVALPLPGSDCELQEVIGNLISKPLDKTKPLWENIILEGYQGEGSCLLLRLHHVLGDGVSLGKLFFNTISTHGEIPEHHHHHHQHKHHDGQGSSSPWGSPMDLLLHPLASLSRVISIPEHLIRGAKIAFSTAEKLARLPTDRNLFKPGKLGRLKRVAWTKEFELEEIGTIRHRFGLTVNDLLLSLICSALRDFALTHQSETYSINDELKATIPVNVAPCDNEEVGNYFAVVIVRFPLSIEDPIERLTLIKKAMDHIKHSQEPYLTFGAVTAMSFLPSNLGNLARDHFTSKMSTAISNVPGPSIPVKVAGEEVERILFFLPASGDLGMTFSIFGYQQRLSIGVVTDEHNPAGSKVLVELVEKAFQEHAALAGGS